MQTLKGGWLGQTFALAKCNESDSGGRKSRIRRSKEERKAMAESFIQRYQKQNNGNFPSLKLTKEEVGGSFYTVREIVREIIQENRVLGPAKFAAGEDSSSDVLEQYPLGSIAIEPQSPLLLPSDGLYPDSKTSLGKDSYKEMEVVSNGHYNGNKFVKDALINGSQTDFGNEESNVAARTELRAAENVGTGVILNEAVSAASKSAIINLTSVEVEEAVTRKDDCLHGTSGEVRDAPGTIKEKDCNEETSRIAISDSEHYGLNSVEQSFLLDEEADLNRESELMRETSTACEGIVHDVDNKATANNEVLIDATVSKGLEEIKNIAEIQGQNDAPNGINLSPCENGGSNKSLEQKESKTEDDDNGTAINTTLDRINLESWEVSSKNTSSKNPVLVILKALIASFVKFWTE